MIIFFFTKNRNQKKVFLVGEGRGERGVAGEWGGGGLDK